MLKPVADDIGRRGRRGEALCPCSSCRRNFIPGTCKTSLARIKKQRQSSTHSCTKNCCVCVRDKALERLRLLSLRWITAQLPELDTYTLWNR